MSHENTLVLRSHDDGVTTLTMNLPGRLNGWTRPMMDALMAAFRDVALDDATKVVILTGADPYYCAGVNLSGTLSFGHPRRLHELIVAHNRALFDSFLDFPKPILAAVNGPAIGASVTSATLCDGIIASEKATFSTPFARVGVTPEGCSSVLFARLMGPGNAERMLGREGWVPTGAQAHEIGLAQWVVPHGQLLPEARRIAAEWVAAGAVRTFRGDSTRDELKAVNARESIGVADSFLGSAFLKNQARFLWSRKKRTTAAAFFSLWALRPLWSRLL